MRTEKYVVCALLALLPTGGVQAQTKLAAKMTCGKPTLSQAAPVGDQPGHVMSLTAQKCTWSEGKLGDDALKDETDTFTSDVIANVAHDRGYGAGKTAGGDQYVVRIKGKTTMNGETPVSSECKWAFTSGTGKLKGVTGKGTCKGTFNKDGSSSWDIQGSYAIPQ